MIRILNIGMNHETAPVDLRECLASDAESPLLALNQMRELTCIKEAVFLSTCNRVETLLTTEDVQQAKAKVVSVLGEIGRVPERKLLASLYMHKGMEAVHHVFRVASSLDSMVVGEPQILGQIKEAYALATNRKMSGVILNRLMHRAFHTAKRVRTETGVCEAAVSISYAAVELAKKIFHVLEGKAALLIGAGEMAELAAKHLMRQGISSISVANRTFHRAVELAGSFKGRAISMEEIDNLLLEVDIVIASTAATEPLIAHGQVKTCMRKRRNRPLFFIDIAVPRDVEPRVNDLDNVYVYDIDDLKGIVQFNKAQRQQEAVIAERIVQEEVVKFEKWLKTLAVVPTIIDLREKVEQIIRNEWRRSRAGLEPLTPSQEKAIHHLTRSVAEKVINDPILFLKRKAERATVNNYLDVTRQLFNMDENGPDSNTQ